MIAARIRPGYRAGEGADLSGFDELVAVVARLRVECPWDRAQTWATLRPYVLEEAYELCEALDRASDDVRTELGDVLFQVVLLSRIAEDQGAFALDDVIRGIVDKMVRRHPHVFAADALTPAQRSDAVGIVAWEARKAAERGAAERGAAGPFVGGPGPHPEPSSALDGVPDALPALLRAHRVSEKAARVGFDWPDVRGVRAKVDEELAELDAAIAGGEADAIGEELGDLLFALVNLGRHLPVSAEDALRTATRKFEARFRRVEARVRAEGRTVYDTRLEDLEAHWQATKREPAATGEV